MVYEYISADNHLDLLWIPGQLWQERLPAKLKAIGPQVIETDDGTFWEWEGKRRGASADGRDNAKYIALFQEKGVTIEDGALPPSDPKYLIEHMDLSKIYAGVSYGDVRKWNIADPELLFEVYRAYNDWCVEINKTNPDRVIMLPQVPTALPERVPDEIRRVAKMGARGIDFSPFDVAQPVYNEVWEPTWQAAAETGMVVCIHIGGSADSAIPPNGRGKRLAFLSTAPMNVANTCAQLVFCGAFERHPDLQVMFGECRIGWVPFLIQWMDRQVIERDPDPTAPLSLWPSEYIARQVCFAFEEDYIGTQMLKFDWSHLQECAVWGSDYPHPQGTWPDVSPPIDKMFETVDPAIRRRVLFEHAAELFHIEGPKD